jgi:hypothetical protein
MIGSYPHELTMTRLSPDDGYAARTSIGQCVCRGRFLLRSKTVRADNGEAIRYLGEAAFPVGPIAFLDEGGTVVATDSLQQGDQLTRAGDAHIYTVRDINEVGNAFGVAMEVKVFLV